MTGRKTMWAIAPLMVLTATVACAAEAAQESVAAESDEVLATVAGIDILQSTVEDAVKSQILDLERQRHQLMERALSGQIDQALIQAEANAQGVTIPELLRVEVNEKTVPVTDAEIDAFYEQRKDQLNQPKEAMVDRIRTHLSGQKSQQVRGNFLRTLRAKHEVESFLDPMRVEVADAEAPSFGPADAPVTLVEFSDFQCPYCNKLVPTIDQVKAEYGDQVRVVFRQFPLERIHANARLAAEASLCADDDGKFWELHDAMFADFRNLSRDRIVEMGAEVGLGDSFVACVDDHRHAGRVTADLAAGRAAGVSGTPAMFVNGRFLSGAVPFERLSAIINEELAANAG